MSSMYPSSGGATARPCARCGAPLAPNESQCSRCGTYNPLPQGQQFGLFQQGAQGGRPVTSGLSWGTQAPQTSQGPQAGNGNGAWGSTGQAGGWPQNNLFGGQEQQGASFQQNLFGAPNGSGFSGQNQSSQNNPFANFQQNTGPSGFNSPFTTSQQNPSQSAFNSFSTFQQNPNQSAFFKATQQNGGFGASSPLAPNRPAWMKRPGEDDEDEDDGGSKRPSAGVVITIVVLVLLVIGAGGYGAYRLILHNSRTTATSTPTGPAIVTPNTTPLFSDSFKNNSAGWDTNPAKGAKITLANNGKMVLESDNNQLFPELLPGGKTFGDFRLDVDAGLTSGDPSNGYGIYIRGASTQNSILGLYYRFEIYGDGSFVIYKGTQDAKGVLDSQPLKSSNPNNAIAHVGQLNHVTIIAKGTQLTLTINNTTVSTFTDNSYKSGTIALFVSNVQKAPAGAQATFENLAIFKA